MCLLKSLFCKHYFSSINTFMRKGKDPDPYLMNPDPRGPKTSGSGSLTLVQRVDREKYIKEKGMYNNSYAFEDFRYLEVYNFIRTCTELYYKGIHGWTRPTPPPPLFLFCWKLRKIASRWMRIICSSIR